MWASARSAVDERVVGHGQEGQPGGDPHGRVEPGPAVGGPRVAPRELRGELRPSGARPPVRVGADQGAAPLRAGVEHRRPSLGPFPPGPGGRPPRRAKQDGSLGSERRQHGKVEQPALQQLGAREAGSVILEPTHGQDRVVQVVVLGDVGDPAPDGLRRPRLAFREPVEQGLGHVVGQWPRVTRAAGGLAKLFEGRVDLDGFAQDAAAHAAEECGLHACRDLGRVDRAGGGQRAVR